MITINSTILSYNKIKEIEELCPNLPPDSFSLPQESNNRSFQKFIPDKYDLDKIEFNVEKQRNSCPFLKNQNTLKKYMLNSMMIMQNDKKDKFEKIESLPINIYNNEKEKSILNINNYKEIEQIQNTNIYQNQKNKINDNIMNNITNLNQNKNKNTNQQNINYNIYNNDEKSDEANKDEIIISKHDISTPNLRQDLLNSIQKNSNAKNILINRNKSKKKNNPDLLEQKRIQSAIIRYNYKNIMRRDPNKENTIIVNTSFYKRNKHKKDNNKSNNYSEINRNSFNSFLKFEESSREQNLINLKKSNNYKKDKKEGIIKQFINSNSNIIINNSKLDQSNINSLIIINNSNTNIILNNSKLDQSNLNSINSKSAINILDNINNKIDSNKESAENKKENEDEEDEVLTSKEKNSVKFNNLNDYTFRTGESNINNIIDYNNLDNKQNNLNNLNNIKINSHPAIGIQENNNSNINAIISQKRTIGSISSMKKFNFDFPKLRDSAYSKKDDNKSKSPIRIIEENEDNKENKEKKIRNIIDTNVRVKFNNLRKILKKNCLFYVLRFLDCYDLMNILQTNRSLILLINKSISEAYYHIIKKSLDKYKEHFEILKCSLIYSKIKEAIKIDFVINIRFVNKTKKSENNNYILLEQMKDYEPKCFQLIYCYKYFKSINPEQKLKTKENTKAIKMYDYYTYDLYSEYDRVPNIYINKEQSSFNNNTDKLAFIQPILPFKIGDKGIINFEIFTSNNDFVDPSSIVIILKSFDLKKHINDLEIKKYNNLRICEYENICFHWKFINNEKSNFFKDIIIKIKKNFENFFDITNISYESIGFFVFKINLVAVKPGRIENYKMDDDLGINIIIRKKNEPVENEIKKNNLLLERRDIYELRVGDTLTLYLSTKKINNNAKK